MTSESGENLDSILARYSFRPDRNIPGVWTRGRRHGRRFVAHLAGDQLHVVRAGARRPTVGSVTVSDTTVAGLEAWLHAHINE